MREDLTTRCDSSSNRPNADSRLARQRAARPFRTAPTDRFVRHAPQPHSQPRRRAPEPLRTAPHRSNAARHPLLAVNNEPPGNNPPVLTPNKDHPWDEHRALVAARSNGAVTPRELREIMPEADARTALDGAVARGLLTRIGRRGGSRYILSAEAVLRAGGAELAARNRRRQALLDEIRRRGSISTAEAATLLNATPSVARRLLDELVNAGLVQARGRTRARRYHLR